MSVAKVTEISACSKESFDDAVRKGIARASKTLTHIKGAWVYDFKVEVEDDKVEKYCVKMKVTFVLKD
jgi:flavin-binding protein dodecin